MAGNPSIAAIVVCTMALHMCVAETASDGGIPKEDSDSFDNYSNNIIMENDYKFQRKRRRSRRRLRRHAGSNLKEQQDQHDGADDGWKEQPIPSSNWRQHEKDRVRNIFESSGDDFLQEQQPPPLMAIEEHDGESYADNVGSDYCTHRQWFPDLTSPNVMACTNSLYPPSSSWDGDPTILHEATMFQFHSSGSCCNALPDLLGDYDSYGTTICIVIDECRGTTTSITTTIASPTLAVAAIPTSDSSTASSEHRRLACGNLGYHPNTQDAGGCTNDAEYPPPWTGPDMKERMFHATSDACCQFFFQVAGETCKVVDACKAAPPTPPPIHPNAGPQGPPPPPPPPPPAPSSGCKWHLNLQTNDGCSDDNQYPPEWISNPTMFHTTADACCKKFMPNKPCKHYARGCDGPIPVAPVPITPRPTAPQVPTRRPTPAPTPQPTPKPLQWWIEETTGQCVESREKKMPEWIKWSWPIYDDCCSQARNTEVCLKARPTHIKGIPLGTNSPTRTPTPKFYADGQGLCLSAFNSQIPPHVKNNYDDWGRCCILASGNPEKCLAKEPAAPSWSGSKSSGEPTLTPPASYYLQDSTAMCINEHEVPMPYVIERTFANYTECCAISWNKETCLASSPTMVPTDFPTLAPSTAWPTQSPICPEAYDSSGTTKYTRGSEIEINSVVYQCKSHPVFCNQEKFQPPEEDPGPEKDTTKPKVGGIPIANTNVNDGDDSKVQGSKLWKEAWERVCTCVRLPSSPPTTITPTSMPTCTTTRWHPMLNRRMCTNNDNFPVSWSGPLLSGNYFTDTAEECCEKFYNNDRCRIRAAC